MTPEDVREWFRDYSERRRAVERIAARVEALSRFPGGGGIPEAVRGGDVGDPTATSANRLMLAEAQLSEARADLDGRTARVRSLCDGIGAALGFDYGFALFDHYVCGNTIRAVADGMCVARSTVTLMFRTAFEWVASVGMAHAMDGTGSAEL